MVDRKLQRVARNVIVAGLLSTLLGACSTLSTTTPHPQLTVEPAAANLDEPVDFHISGLSAHYSATLQLTSTDGAGTVWTSRADYVSDTQGAIDVATASAAGGSYTGIAGMGPIASMQPAAGPAGYRWPKTPADFTATVTSAGTSTTTTFTRTLVRPGDSIEYSEPTVHTDGFSGFYATTTAEKTQRHPAVLLLGGSEGGNDQQVTAAALTLHGLSAMSVAYFDADQLPKTLTDIPLEYFAKALRWLRSQPGVDPQRIWVMGTSRGSEAAQLLGVDYPRLVHGVIASSPSNIVNCSYPTGNKPCVGAAWTYRGKPVPYSADFDNPKPSDNPAAVIADERINGPVVVVCGEADQVWQSCRMGQAILTRRKTHQVGNHDRLFSYPDAGHGVGGLLPYNLTSPQPRLQGRTPADDYQALGDVWPKVLQIVKPD